MTASTNPYQNPEASFECPIMYIPGAVAGQDMITNQFCFVTLTSAGTWVPTGAAGLAGGVLQDKPYNLQACGVMAIGISRVIAGAAIAAGQQVSSDANGNAIPTTGGNPVLGVAQQAAAGAGSVIPVKLLT